METDEARRRALESLLEDAGYEPRFASTREDVERELHRSPPEIVAVHRRGPVSPEELSPLIRELKGRTELRIVPEYSQALLGVGPGDERLPRFLFDLTRFLLRRIARRIDSRIASGRSRVVSKKKRRPVRVALMVACEIPVKARCSWKRRRSSASAVSGERPRKRVNFFTARM